MVIELILLIIFVIILLVVRHIADDRQKAEELLNSEGLGFPIVNFLLNKKTTNPH